MTDKIDKLTPEQEAEIPRWRKAWLDALSTDEPMQPDVVTSVLTDVFEELGEPTPLVFTAPSPLTALRAIEAWDQEIAGEEFDSEEELRDTVQHWIDEDVAKRDDRPPFRSPWHTGHTDGWWVAHYRFCEAILGVKFDEQDSRRLALMERLVRSCGWIYAFQNVVIVAERPTVSWSDGEPPELSSTTGPAWEFQDGFKGYAIDGHEVPEYVVERPEEITVQRIADEDNAEVRRLMIERYVGGPGKYLTDAKAKVIDTDSVPTDARFEGSEPLHRALLEVGDDLYLVGTDGSTKRTYYMPIPTDQGIQTCRAAHEAISQLDEERCLSQG